MERDWRGLPLTGAGGDVAARIGAFQVDFQQFDDGAAAIADIAGDAPGCLAAQVYAAAVHLYAQVASEIEGGANPLLDRAAGLVEGATPREQLLYAAVRSWAACDFPAALGGFEDLLARWPEDVTAVKLAEFVLFQSPDFPRHLRLMDSVAAANEDLACFGAMHAFAHELNARYAEARRLAERALEIDADTPWAHHALGHVFLNTGRWEDGVAALAGFLPSWDRHSLGIREHNAWHLALLHLAAGDVAAALDLYRDRFSQQDPASAFEHTDAVSFLWRLELMGEAVDPALWGPIVPYAEERAADRVFPFMNAHYLYALARAGRVGTARTALAELSGPGHPLSPAWEVGLPLLRGVVALAEEDWPGAARAMAPVVDAASCVGGSDAQNELFEQSYLVALARSGRADVARRRLARRTGDRAPGPRELAWLG
jgi:tetratricopeptide (TPR) repeat protein